MATKQKFSNETLFVETTVVADSINPPTSGAVYSAIGGASVAGVVADTVFEKIYMSANDTVYEVTIDEDGALAVAEVEEEAEA